MGLTGEIYLPICDVLCSLTGLDTLGRYSTDKGDNFCAFMFAFLHTKPF